MTIAETRILLGLGPEFTDAQVAEAYAEYVGAGGGGGAAELVPLALVKKHLGLLASETDDDDIIAHYLAAAIASIDGEGGWLGRALTERVYVRTFDRLGSVRRLPYPPVVSITGVETQSAGTWSPLAPSQWDLEAGGLAPAGAGAWPGGRVRVTYRAGYDPDAGRPLPLPIVQAVLLMVEDMYRHRGEVAAGNVSKVPSSAAVESLLGPYRVYPV